MTDTIVFDIDGTLSNLDHRLHHLQGDGRRPNWDAFFEEMWRDQPIADVCWLAEIISSRATVFVFTGRPEKYRKQTEDWLWSSVPYLMKHVELTGAVMMRPDGDYRADTIVKKEMLDGVRGQGFDVRIVVDDRQSVVDMWRVEGVTCLQAAASDWEKKKFAPGDLTMMVGPSCGGKSTFVELYIQYGLVTPDAIICTDVIREQVYGSRSEWDASKQDQVHGAAIAQAVARIEHGLEVIYDATNLRNRDRRRIRDAMPADTNIVYVVKDRPLEIKLREAGWRKDVKIKGKPLIEYHHDIFQSNLKAILAGDNDPRVSVVDTRLPAELYEEISA